MKPQWRKDRLYYEIISKRSKKNQSLVKSPDDAYELLKPYRNEQKEHFILITLNATYKPISVSIVSIGIIDRTLVQPREVFIRALQDNASKIIISHNHPSGFLKPSEEDNEVMERMCDAGEIIGIRVIDHIIFSKNGYASLRKNGYFKTREKNE